MPAATVIFPDSYSADHFKAVLTNVETASALKVRLMATGFVFDPAAHSVWADVSASELANGNGYTTGGITLAGIAVTTSASFTVNGAGDYRGSYWSANPAVWTAAGGSIGPSPGAIILDDTATGDPLGPYLRFAAERTATDGNTFTVTVNRIAIGRSNS